MNVEESRLRQIIRQEIRAALTECKSCTPSPQMHPIPAGTVPYYGGQPSDPADRLARGGEPRAPCGRPHNPACGYCAIPNGTHWHGLLPSCRYEAGSHHHGANTWPGAHR